MMTDRLVCSVYVCMYRSKLWCDDRRRRRRRRRRRSEHFSLFLPFTTREEASLWTDIFLSFTTKKEKGAGEREREGASKVKVI